MVRTKKCRMVSSIPSVTYFKPAGIPCRFLEEVCLSVEEAEALRLKDLEGLEQIGGAAKMGISRPTFQRVLSSARKKVADAILNGKAIRIEGGNFHITGIKPGCQKASHCPVCEVIQKTLLTGVSLTNITDGEKPGADTDT